MTDVISAIAQCSGAEKASIMMLALSEADVARLFGLLDHQEVMEISQTMAVLGRVDAGVVEALLLEFASASSATAASPVGSTRPRSCSCARSIRAGRVDHAGNPRPRRPDGLGQARPRQRNRARFLLKTNTRRLNC